MTINAVHASLILWQCRCERHRTRLVKSAPHVQAHPNLNLQKPCTLKQRPRLQLTKMAGLVAQQPFRHSTLCLTCHQASISE